MVGTTATLQAIMSKTFNDGENLSEHIGWMRQNNLYLLNTPLHLNDQILSTRLLASLPPSWEPLRMTINTWDTTKLTFSQVSSTLLAEGQRREMSIGTSSNPIVLNTTNRTGGKQQQKRGKCTQCGCTNHTVETCWVLNPQLKKLPKNKQQSATKATLESVHVTLNKHAEE